MDGGFGNDYVTREHILTLPGGPDALRRWEGRDDAAYERHSDAITAISDAEDIANGCE